MIIFDGYQLAAEREQLVRSRVNELATVGTHLKIGAILFSEDQGSQLYTRLKREAGERLGIGYEVSEFSLRQPVFEICEQIAALNNDTTISGIIIQKPWRKTWEDLQKPDAGRGAEAFNAWWHQLTSALAEQKDVDGLHPATLASIELGTWRQQGKVLPATCRAVLTILEHHELLTGDKKFLILGRSELLGQPLYHELKNQGRRVELLGMKAFRERADHERFLRDGDVVISATGHAGLITGDMVREGVAAIDVGEPRPDFDFLSVSEKAAFISPVPGGVGPITVVSLMENAVDLMQIDI